MKIKQLGIVSGVALATLVTASAAQAALVVVPPGLNPGDRYRLVFITNDTNDATSANIDDYNTFVTTQATKGTKLIDTALDKALNGAGFDPNKIEWKAIGSTALVDARDNTGTNPTIRDGFPIYLINGNLVANNNVDLWNGGIARSININQHGKMIESGSVWTGTKPDGTAEDGLSRGKLGDFLPGTGDPTVNNSGWIQSGFSGSLWSNRFHLYAMSEVLSVPVPEPSSLLGLITLGGLMLGGAVRKARK